MTSIKTNVKLLQEIASKIDSPNRRLTLIQGNGYIPTLDQETIFFNVPSGTGTRTLYVFRRKHLWTIVAHVRNYDFYGRLKREGNTYSRRVGIEDLESSFTEAYKTLLSNSIT